MCSKGFTLAETLITLGIIGVVAAMTLPTLIGKYQKIIFVTRMKQTYTIVANAFITSKSNNGDPTEWDFGSEFSNENIKRIVTTYLSPYLNKTSEGFTSDNVYYIKLKNGIILTFELDGCSDLNTCTPVYVNTLYIIGSINNNTSDLYNNKRDFSRKDFMMRFDKSNKGLVYFHGGSGANAKRREDAINHPEYGCNKNIPKYKRYTCGQLIYLDGWQIKDDYPW